MSEKFDIEELLREHLLDATEPIPPDLFDEIEAIVLSGKKGKRFLIFWWIVLGLGLGVFVASTYVGPFMNEDESNLAKHIKPTSHTIQGESTHPSNQEAPEDLNRRVSDLAPDHPLTHNSNTHTLQGQTNSSDPDISALQPGSKNPTTANPDYPQFSHSGGNTDNNHLNQTATNNTGTYIQPKEDTADSQTENSTQYVQAQENINTSETNQHNSLPSASISDNGIAHNTHPPAAIDLPPDTTSKDDPLLNITDSTLTSTAPIETDTIPQNDSTSSQSPPSPKTSQYGLLVYGGYSAFDMAVFKPYFESGLLSKRDFESSGFEIGLGVYRKIGNRFTVQLTGNYGQQRSGFTYDLLVTENDFHELYKNEQLIPADHLDNPDECNCFLAEDVSLRYTINTFSFSLGGSYDLLLRPKYTFGPQFSFGSIASTKFTNEKNSIIAFSEQVSETFTGTRLEFGLNFHYKLSEKIHLGLSPTYGFQFTKKSDLYTKTLRKMVIPLQLKIAF